MGLCGLKWPPTVWVKNGQRVLADDKLVLSMYTFELTAIKHAWKESVNDKTLKLYIPKSTNA